jgi:hypothetical protein
VYAPRPDATPEGELSALAAVYAFVLDCRTNTKTTQPGGPDDDEKELERRRLCQTKM